MAFEGNLRDLEFGDVVQTLSLTRQHGTLVVQGTEERRIAFTDRGLAVLSARRSHGERVGSYLLGTGRIAADALDSVRRSTRRVGGAEMGDALLSAKAVDPAALLEARRYVAQEDLFDLFRWSDGHFEFHSDDLTLSGPFASIWFDVSGIAMEAARRIDESPYLDSLVPRGDVLTRGEPTLAPPDDGSANDLAKLYALADGTRTIGDLVDEYHLGQFDTRKRLAALVENGALRSASADEILAIVDRAAEPAQAARLLRRAVTLEPTNRDAWSMLAKALAASGEKPAAAIALTELANLQYSDGEGETALGALRTALKFDRQSARAHATLTHILLALELMDEAVEAAHDAVTECLAGEAPQIALDIALAALAHAPTDTRLARGSAAAYAALGRPVEAVAVLDRVAHDLTRQRGQEKELIEIYRSILSLAPDRADCNTKLHEIAEREANRKRRRRQLIAIAAGVTLVAAIGLPAMLGSSTQERLDRMNELVVANDLDTVQLMLNELREEGIDEELLTNAADALDLRVQQSRRPPLDEALPRELRTRLDGIYSASREALAEQRIVTGLNLLESAMPEVDSAVMTQIEESDPNAAKEFREEFDNEVRAALSETEEHCVELAAWATLAKDELDASEALKRARFRTESTDLDELETLAARAEEIETAFAKNDWDELPKAAERLIEATRTKQREFKSRIETSVVKLVAVLQQARDLGEHAVAHVHRVRLFAHFRETKNDGMDLTREGKLEDAAERYREYLKFCLGIRDTDRGEVYERIVSGYLDAFQLEALIGEELEHVESILARERTAAVALNAGDVETAFEMRVGLVRDFPRVGFGARFALPLRIESRPAGAEIVLRTAEGDRAVGRTTSIVEYPAVGESTIIVRMDGFEDVVLARHGAFDDADGSESLDLMKRPLWRSAEGAATEAAPVAWRDRVFVADRDGIVRALSLKDGTELGRLETGLLGGFAGTPALRENQLYLAGVDGVGFVVDPASLEIVERFELPGAVRTSLFATNSGVVIVDERGTIHLIDARGKDIWAQDVGRVVVDPVVTEDRIVVVTTEGNLVVLALADGKERRRVRIPGQPRWSAPTIVGSHVFVTAENGPIAAVDLHRGLVTWEADAGETLAGRPAVSGSFVAVPTAGGRMLVFDQLHEGPPASDDVGPIRDGVSAVSDGFVAAGRTGVVRRLDLHGDLVWRFDAGDAIGARPVLVAGHVLIVTRAGCVVALSD